MPKTSPSVHLLLLLVATSLSAQIDPFATYPCCNTATGEIVGELSITACSMRPGHVPDIPGIPQMAQAAEACRDEGGESSSPSTGSGTYSDSPVWTTFQDNIPNGDFEEWQDDDPAGFTSYSNEMMKKERQRLGDWKTVERSDDGLESPTAVLIRNHQPDPHQLTQEQNIPAVALQYLKQLVLPGGLVSCRDCAVETGGDIRSAEDEMGRMSFPIEKVGRHLCGAFKSRLKGGDTLMVSAVVMRGDEALGGATLMDVLTGLLSRESDGWTKFKVPIYPRPGMETSEANRGVLQIQIVPPGGLQAMAGSVFPHPESEVLVDRLHFCAGLDLQITDAESSGGRIVPDSKDMEGGVVFVNLDNDDKDDGFDDNDPGGVEGGDDELAQLLLQLPSGSEGKIRLDAKKGKDRIRIFTEQTKASSQVYQNLGKELELPADFTDTGVFLQKVLWVEGVDPSEATSDVVFELTYTPKNTAEQPETDEVALTVLRVEDLEWLGKGNSVSDDDLLDCDPNHPANRVVVHPGQVGDGAVRCYHEDDADDRPVRVFPGKRYEGGAATGRALDRVGLLVRLNVAPPRRTPVFLQAFDVDDPTADNDEVDDESKVEDNRGTSPARTGKFPFGEGDFMRLEMDKAEMETDFQVTKQPGDNFRVLASSDEDEVRTVENDDTVVAPGDGERLVDPDVLAAGVSPEAAEVRDAERRVSDTLTVWRFLHVERDSMGEVQQALTGRVTSVEKDPAHRLRYVLTTDLDIVARRPPSAHGSLGQWDSFDGGVLRVVTNDYEVAASTALGRPEDRITLVDNTGLLQDPVHRQLLVGKPFRLVDDDVSTKTLYGVRGSVTVTFEDGAEIPLPPGDRLEQGKQEAFRPAYVYPKIDTIPSGKGEVPFLANIKNDDPAYVRSLFASFDQVKNQADPDLWTVYLLGAFQGVHWEDADGRMCALGMAACNKGGTPVGQRWVGAVAGEADASPGKRDGVGALIYWESGAELEIAKGRVPGWRLIDAVPHEIGHLFGSGHEDGGLMSDGAERRLNPTADFSPVTLDKIRSSPHP